MIERTTVSAAEAETADHQLVTQAKAGDSGAFAALVRAHQTVAFRTAWFIVGDAADAEEVAQEAFVKAWSALDRFRDGAPFRPWLLAIVANLARNRRRSRGRAAELALRAAAAHAPVAPSAEDGAERREQQAVLVDALERLRESDRLVIACRYLLDLSERETAAALGWPRGTVKSRLSRALNRLRAELEGATP